MTAGLSADFYSSDRVTFGTASNAAGTATPSGVASTVQLGPIMTADWQLRVPTPAIRDLTFYVVDRYRTSYQRERARVDGSSANYFDAGVNGVLPLGRSTGVLVRLNGRHQTGLGVDATLATAAVRSAALLLGLDHQSVGGMSIQPFVRAQKGQLKSGTASNSLSGTGGGLTVGMRF